MGASKFRRLTSLRLIHPVGINAWNFRVISVIIHFSSQTALSAYQWILLPCIQSSIIFFGSSTQRWPCNCLVLDIIMTDWNLWSCCWQFFTSICKEDLLHMLWISFFDHDHTSCSACQWLLGLFMVYPSFYWADFWLEIYRGLRLSQSADSATMPSMRGLFVESFLLMWCFLQSLVSGNAAVVGISNYSAYLKWDGVIAVSLTLSHAESVSGVIGLWNLGICFAW